VYPISLGRVDPSTLSHGSSTNLCSGSTPYPPPSVLYCALQATPPSPATACSPRLEPAPVYRPLPYLSPNAPRSGIHALPPLHRYSTGHASLAGDLMVSATRTRAGLPKLHPSRIYLLTPPLRYPRPTPPTGIVQVTPHSPATLWSQPPDPAPVYHSWSATNAQSTSTAAPYLFPPIGIVLCRSRVNPNPWL